MTNPLCECPIAGYCKRHKIFKTEPFHALCNGTAVSNDCGWKYWQAWERGKLGATPPKEPILNPPRFCDDQKPGGVVVPCSGCGGGVVERPSMIQRVSSAAAAAVRFVGDGMQATSTAEESRRRELCRTCPLNDNGTCNGCGCIIDMKIKGRLEECPAKRWHQDLHPQRPLVDPTVNLMMHVLPVAGNGNWKWNLDQIAARVHLFTGRRILAIAHEPRDQVHNKPLKTVEPDEVLAYSDSIGLHWTHSQAFKNHATLREVSTFPWLLEQANTGGSNTVTFACHAKGVTHSENSITVKWAERQFRACLDDWTTVRETLERYSMAGAFRRFGQFSTPGNHRWHYSGTSYWFRNDDVFESGKNWGKVDQHFFGTESWPGLMFEPAHCACLFGDEAGDLYQDAEWIRLQREIDVWEGARI